MSTMEQSTVKQDINNTSNEADLKKNRNMRLMQRLEKKYSEQGDQKTLLENDKPQQAESQGISGTEKLQLMKKRDQITEKYERLSIIISAAFGIILAILSINQGSSDLGISSLVNEKANQVINAVSLVSKYGKVIRQLADDTSVFLFTFVVFSQIIQIL